MTRTEHLETIAKEECVEVALSALTAALRASKSLRFGSTEVQPGQGQTNAERVRAEVWDLLGVYEMLEREAGFPPLGVVVCLPEAQAAVAAKQQKVETYLGFSAGRGLVDDIPADPHVQHPEAK